MLDATVVRTISAITYPIRHEFARLAPNRGLDDRDLDTFGGASTHILVTGLAERQFTSHNPDFDYSQLVGRIVPARPSRPHAEQWYMSDEDNGGNGGAYLTGARVSPTPVNGRLYQELRDLPGEMHSSPFVLRFNDEEHREDRAHRDNPWTIVWAQDGLEHNVGVQRVNPPVAWVEVRSPLTPVTTGLASDEDIELILSEVDETAAVVAAATYMDNTTEGHTLGKAHLEENGRVHIDPPKVPGEMYLTWYNGNDWYRDHAMLQVATADERLVSLGYFNRGVDGNVYYHDDIWADVRGPGWGADTTMHWAKVAMTDPDVNETTSTERAGVLTTQAEESHEAFENLNDALNELARQQSWCGEYERTMDAIGMRHRRSGGRVPFDPDNLTDAPTERHAYDVEFTVDVTIRDDSPSYRVTNMLESEYSAYSVSELRFDASINVTVRGIVADNEEQAEESVTQSQISDELDGMIEGEFEINDYSHSDTNEDTDFDWDEYDENF
jgi:hypothetical protein